MEPFVLTLGGESFTVNAPTGFTDSLVAAYTATFGFESDTTDPAALATEKKRFVAGRIRDSCLGVLEAYSVRTAEEAAAEAVKQAFASQVDQLKVV